MLSKVVSSTIFKVFGMTRPGIEPRSPGPLANTLTAGPMSRLLMETNPIMWRKLLLKNKVIINEEFNMKESRRYNVSVSINYLQDIEICYEVSLDPRWMINEIQNKTSPDDGLLKLKRYNGDFLSY